MKTGAIETPGLFVPSSNNAFTNHARGTVLTSSSSRIPLNRQVASSIIRIHIDRRHVVFVQRRLYIVCLPTEHHLRCGSDPVHLSSGYRKQCNSMLATASPMLRL